MKYPSNLTDVQWGIIKRFFKRGNKAKHDKRDLVNAVFYLTKTGCQWRQLPNNFPNWPTVYSFYRRAKQEGIWEKMMHDLVKKSRVRMGRQVYPTYSIIDSQSVKTTDSSEERGIDGGKKNQRKKAPHCC